MICVLPMCAPAVFAQPTQQDFEWAWKDAASMILPEGTHASWIELVYPQMTGEEATALLDQIGENQADPRWATARQAQWLNGEPRRSKYELWYIDDSHFRLNHDLPQAEWSPHIDAVVNGHDGWICGANGVLTVLDLRNTPRMRDSRSYLDEVQSFVRNFFSAGMGRYQYSTVQSFEADQNDRWSADIMIDQTGDLYRLIGDYKRDTEQFVLTESRLIRSEKRPDSIGSALQYHDYKLGDAVHWYLPQKVVQTKPNGSVSREYRMELIGRFNINDFEAYAKVPSGDNTDLLRPDIVLRRIDNYSKRSSTRTEYDADTGERTVTVLADDRVFANRTNWNLIGIASLVLLVVAFVISYLKRG